MPLINSDSWKAEFLSLRSLRFHPKNPRFPEIAEGSSERQIIEVLCERGDVLSLAKTIAEKGYLRNDRLIVVKDGSKSIVYEGNRRLCALKVLDKPELAPIKKRKAYEKLKEKAVLPKKIAVEIVPSKFDAEVVMYAKHTEDGFMRKWSPVQKAAFLVGQVEEGVSVDELCLAKGLSKDEVLSSLAVIDLYKIARTVGLSDKAKAMLDDPDQFPYSTVFERLFIPKQSRDKLGVEFTSTGLVVRATRDSFLGAVRQMMEDAAGEEIDTRKLNKAEDQLAYAEKLGVVKAKDALKVTDFSVETAPANKSAELQKGAQATRVAKSVKVSGMLFPSDLTIGFEHEKLSRMLEEGKMLKVHHAHAAALLLRSFIEISISVWLKKKGKLHTITARNSEFGPSLSELLNHLNSEKSNLGLEPSVKTTLDALVSKKIKHSKFELDRITHAPDAIATEENVTELRGLALPLLRWLLA